MSAPTLYTLTGNADSLLLLSEQTAMRADGLDSGTFIYSSPTERPFTRGQAVPDYAGLYVQDTQSTRKAGAWRVETNVIGLRGAALNRPQDYPRGPVRSAEGWDEVQDQTIIASPTGVQLGSRLFGAGIAGIFYAVNVSPEPVPGTGRRLYRVNATYKGMAIGLERHIGRSYQRAEITIQGSNIRWPYSGGGTSWTNYTKGRVTIPVPVVEDTYLSLNPPDVNAQPSSRTPPNSPQPFNWFVNLSQSYRRYWPNGWTYSVTGEQPFGQNIPLYIVKRRYQWQPPILTDDQA